MLIKWIKARQLIQLGRSQYSLPEIPLDKIEKVLIEGQGMIGDALTKVPFIRQLKAAMPHLIIDVWVSEYSQEVYYNKPYINKCLIQPSVETINKEEYDVYISFMDGIHKGILNIYRRLKVKNIYMLSQPSKYGVTEKKIAFVTKFILSTEVERYRRNLDLLKLFGVEPNYLDKTYDMNYLETPEISKFISNIQQPYVLINPKASTLLKTLEDNLFLKLVSALTMALPKIQLVVLTLPQDREHYEEILSKENENRAIVSPITHNILELAAVVRKAKGLISVDTGTVHIASSFNIPTIGFYYIGHNGYTEYRSMSDQHCEILFESGKGPIDKVNEKLLLLKSMEFFTDKT